MTARAVFLFVFAIFVASTIAKESKSAKRQAQYIGQGEEEDRQIAFVDPQTGQLVDARTGQPVDPRTGQLVDPRTGQPVDPRTGRLVDPRQQLNHQSQVDQGQVDPARIQAFQLGFQRQPQQELSPEYAQLLRLIDGGRGGVQGAQQQFLQPNLASRRPQQFRGQPAPAPVRLTPEQIEQNQIQEGIASKSIREQEVRDAQRAQELQFLQQQGITPEILRELQLQSQLIPRGQLGGDPRFAEIQQRQAQAQAQAEAQARAQAQAEKQARAEAQAQQRQAQEEAEARAQAEKQARAQAEAQARAHAEAQARAQAEAQKRAQEEEEARAREDQSRAIAATLAARAQLQPSPKSAAQLRQPQYDLQSQYEREPIPAGPERISYSTVQFGSSKLPQPPRLFTSPPSLSQRQRIYQASHPQAPQPSPLPEYVEIPQQQSVYKQKIQYSPEDYGEAPLHPGIPEVIVKDRQTPNQYLIETSNFEANPRPINVQPVFRPQPAALREPQGSIAAQRVAEERARAIYTQQALEAATTPSPSKSSIFVSTSRTPSLRPKPHQEPEVHQQGGRPLTQGELKALLNAGFTVHPHSQRQQQQQQQQYIDEEPSGVTYYQRGARLGKRMDKPVPKPVPLTEDDRRALAREGIHGLYRIEPAGTEEESNAKYVVAIGKPFPSH
ncbi:hypothetical protein GE061_019988 [Apolygus lucorum]|uniref:Zasp-like motif domain-containing protein n=1 Tax=Apolygus lucorum TaxID=248454 RepID=A0A8S9XBA0_APOLU|nr:hypothetical protein GE061_019988 [Apolygus lucorum]